MKHLIIIFVLLSSFGSVAQHSEKRERIKALKVAFITERLDLTESEAQKFWPIYNAFDLEEDMQRRLMHEKRKKITSDITEAEAKIILNDMVAFENERQKLKADYIESLIKVLPAKKIIQLKIAEDEFNRKMFEQYKKRKEGSKPNHDKP